MEAEQAQSLETIAAELEERLNREIDRVTHKVGCDRMASRLALTAMGRISVSNEFQILGCEDS